MFTYCITQCSSVDTLPFCVSGNMLRLVLSMCCCQSCTFERNPFILSVFVSRLSFQPCIPVFIFRCRNISAMYASLAHHSSLASSFASLHPSLVKNTFSSTRSSYTQANILPRGNHRTSVMSNKTCAPLPFPHTEMQICGFLAILPLQSLSCAQHLPAQVRQVCWWSFGNKDLPVQKTVCNDNISCLSFTRLTNPFMHPTMAAAPSVQTLMQFSHVSPPCSRYSDATRNISSPVVFSGNALQNGKFLWWLLRPQNAHWPKVEHSHRCP